MRSVEVIYRPEAISDLEDIFRFVEENSQSETVASCFVANNGTMPKYRACPTWRQAARRLGERSAHRSFERTAVIVYRVTSSVEITNIFYGGRDYETLYRDDPKDE